MVLTPYVNKWLYTKIPPSLLPLGVKISHRIFKKKQEKPGVSQKELERIKLRFRPNVLELNTYLNATGLLTRDLVSLWQYQEN